MASNQASSTVARVLDSVLPQLDKNNDRKIDYKEFKELKLPGLEKEETKREVFEAIAKANGNDKGETTITRENINTFLKTKHELAVDKLAQINDKLFNVQAKASQSTIDLFLEAGGKVSNPVFQDGKLFDTAKNVMLVTTAKNMNAKVTDPIVSEAVEKSSLWKNEVTNIRNGYFEEQKAIFKDITPDTVQKMVNIAGADKEKGYEKLSALEFSLARFAGDRKDLQISQPSINVLMRALKNEENPPSVLAQVTFHLHGINELNSKMGEVFVNAASRARMDISDPKLKGVCTATRNVREAELLTAGIHPDELSMKLLFDQTYRQQIANLPARYGAEVTKIFNAASPENLIAIHREIESESPVNAHSLFEAKLYESGLSEKTVKNNFDRLSKLGFTPDPFSEKVGDQVASSLKNYLDSIAENASK